MKGHLTPSAEVLFTSYMLTVLWELTLIAFPPSCVPYSSPSVR